MKSHMFPVSLGTSLPTSDFCPSNKSPFFIPDSSAEGRGQDLKTKPKPNSPNATGLTVCSRRCSAERRGKAGSGDSPALRCEERCCRPGSGSLARRQEPWDATKTLWTNLKASTTQHLSPGRNAGIRLWLRAWRWGSGAQLWLCLGAGSRGRVWVPPGLLLLGWYLMPPAREDN